MSRLTDNLFELEHELAKYPGDNVSDAQNRRLILRRAMCEWGNLRYAEGHLAGIAVTLAEESTGDGGRDEREPRRLAERRAAAAADDALSSLRVKLGTAEDPGAGD